MIEIQERGVRIRKLIVLFHSYGGRNALKNVENARHECCSKLLQTATNSVETNK